MTTMSPSWSAVPVRGRTSVMGPARSSPIWSSGTVPERRPRSRRSGGGGGGHRRAPAHGRRRGVRPTAWWWRAAGGSASRGRAKGSAATGGSSGHTGPYGAPVTPFSDVGRPEMERPSSLCNRSCSFTDRSAAGVSDALSRTGCTARRTRCGPSGQGRRRTAPRPVGASTRVPGRIADGGGGLARPHLNHAVIALAEDDQVPASPHHSVITVAGKTRGGQPPACTRADHPRVVGEGQGTASTIGFVQRPSVGRHDGAARVGPGAEHPHVGGEDCRGPA